MLALVCVCSLSCFYLDSCTAKELHLEAAFMLGLSGGSWFCPANGSCPRVVAGNGTGEVIAKYWGDVDPSCQVCVSAFNESAGMVAIDEGNVGGANGACSGWFRTFVMRFSVPVEMVPAVGYCASEIRFTLASGGWNLGIDVIDPDAASATSEPGEASPSGSVEPAAAPGEELVVDDCAPKPPAWLFPVIEVAVVAITLTVVTLVFSFVGCPLCGNAARSRDDGVVKGKKGKTAASVAVGARDGEQGAGEGSDRGVPPTSSQSSARSSSRRRRARPFKGGLAKQTASETRLVEEQPVGVEQSRRNRGAKKRARRARQRGTR